MFPFIKEGSGAQEKDTIQDNEILFIVRQLCFRGKGFA
jgi:hypothetical protein